MSTTLNQHEEDCDGRTDDPGRAGRDGKIAPRDGQDAQTDPGKSECESEVSPAGSGVADNRRTHNRSQQVDSGNWAFKGVQYYIEKSLKIPYTYVDAHGVTIEDYLLIGFAGGGAY